MISVLIERYSDQNDEWDGFAQESRNGTIFHLRKFLSYHPSGRFEDHSLLFHDGKDRVVAVFPACNIGGRLVSHPGASYGGPALASRAGAEMTDSVVKLLIDYAQASGFSAVVLSPSPSVYHSQPTEDLDYALRRHGFVVDRLALSTVVSLGSGATMRSDTLRSTRRAQHFGVTVSKSEDWAEFWTILEDTLRRRHGAKPTHSLDEITTLVGRFPDRINLFCADSDGRMIGGMVTFACTGRVLLAFYYATDYSFQGLRPLNAIIPWVMSWAAERGFRYLDHGISTEGDDAIPNWGLFRFKEGFGIGGVARRRWRRELLNGAV